MKCIPLCAKVKANTGQSLMRKTYLRHKDFQIVSTIHGLQDLVYILVYQLWTLNSSIYWDHRYYLKPNFVGCICNLNAIPMRTFLRYFSGEDCVLLNRKRRVYRSWLRSYFYWTYLVSQACSWLTCHTAHQERKGSDCKYDVKSWKFWGCKLAIDFLFIALAVNPETCIVNIVMKEEAYFYRVYHHRGSSE